MLFDGPRFLARGWTLIAVSSTTFDVHYPNGGRVVEVVEIDADAEGEYLSQALREFFSVRGKVPTLPAPRCKSGLIR